MHQPSVSDFHLLKRILRYVKGTVTQGVNISASTHSTLVCYSDSDWAGCKDTRRSTGGSCTFLGSNLISWSAKRHETVSKSSTEAEYRTMSLAASEVAWLQNLLQIMGLEQKITPLLLCDNLSAVCLSANPRFHRRTKHFEVDYHYVRERVAMKKLEVRHIPATLQIADVFTKFLGQEPFFRLCNILGVSISPTLSLRGCNDSSDHGPLEKVKEQSQTHTVTTKVQPNPPLSSSVKQKAVKVQSSCSSTTRPANSITVGNRFECLGTQPIMC